jgi:hypothetical protein
MMSGPTTDPWTPLRGAYQVLVTDPILSRYANPADPYRKELGCSSHPCAATPHADLGVLERMARAA